MTVRLKSDSWADSPLKIQPQKSALVKKLLCLSRYLSGLWHKQGEEAVVSCAHTDAHPARLCPAKPGALCSEQIAAHSSPDLPLSSSTHLSLKMLMLPKARSPIVWDPTFPRDGASMPGSANHSFCPWLEEQFQNETKDLMTGEKIVQQQTQLL